MKANSIMELRQLRYFIEAADRKSFSRAAATFGITPRRLSRQIRLLEDQLGAALFHRHSRGASLTQLGQQYYDKVGALPRRLDEAWSEIRDVKHLPVGEVVIGVPSQLGTAVIVPLIKRFGARLPHIPIRVSESFSYQIAERLFDGQLDLGIVYDPDMYRHLTNIMTVEEALFLIGPAGDPVTARSSIPLRVALEHPLVVPNLPSTLRRCVADAATKLGVVPRWVFELDSTPAMKRLVIDGAGYAILPRAAVHDEMRQGLLSATRIVDPEVARAVGVVVPVKGGTLPVAIQQVAAAIGDALRDLMANGVWVGRAAA